MKKIFSLIIFSVFSLSTIHAEMSWDLSDDGTLTISGTEIKGAVPEKIPWAYQTGKIKKVIIEDGVTYIGGNAFYGCTNLTSVTIPNSVTRIEYQAFGGCSSLTSVIIPNSVTHIGESAFGGCSALTSIIIPKSVTSIERYAFYYCSSVTSLTIGSSVTSIGEYAFQGCSNIASLIIPNSVTNIGSGAFSGCSGLTSVTLGNSVKSVQFNACYNIKEIYSWSSTPPAFYFDEAQSMHTKVFVPEGSAEAYKYASGWKNFLYIYEMEYSPVLSEAEPITVSDATPTVTKGYYKENTITYVREGAAISKDNYASFCLPFAVDPSDAQFKAVYVPVGIALYNTETNTLRIGFYKSNEIIPAGTPFLAKLAVDDKVEIKNALPVNYDSNEPAVKAKVIRTFDFYEHSGIMIENDNYSINFTGTYKKISPANACTFNIDGSAGPSANVFPFRAYIALTKNNTNAKIIANFDEDAETTGIKELLISNDKSPVYDLNGRVVNENTQKSGIYIKNGKKYVK